MSAGGSGFLRPGFRRFVCRLVFLEVDQMAGVLMMVAILGAAWLIFTA